MGKRLTTQAKMQRLHNQGFSDGQIASVTGFSKSSVGRIRRGQQGGEKIAPAIDEFFKLGKRAKENVRAGLISLPSAKLKIVSPLRRAEGKISQLDKSSEVVIQVTMKGTGKSRTLYARGGVWVGQVKNDLKGAIESQYGRQYDGGLDWNDVIDIDVQEY
jgi:hypothetical protein